MLVSSWWPFSCPGHDVKLPRPGGPLSARHRSPLGVAGQIFKRLSRWLNLWSFPSSFLSLYRPLGPFTAFGASWSCVLDGGGGLALGGALAEDTLALRNPRALMLVAAATLLGPNCRRAAWPGLSEFYTAATRGNWSPTHG